MSDQPAKTLDDSFRDWEAGTFGYGYGSGEPHIIPALRLFFQTVPERQYDFEALEAALTPTVAWLLINVLCHEGLIEYGTSPRHGWFTAKGQRLRDYVLSKPVDELLEVLRYDSDYVVCHRDACNCGPSGYVEGVVCPNPFWRD